MNNFFNSIKQNTTKKMNENITNEQKIHKKELEDNEIIQHKDS